MIFVAACLCSCWRRTFIRELARQRDVATGCIVICHVLFVNDKYESVHKSERKVQNLKRQRESHTCLAPQVELLATVPQREVGECWIAHPALLKHARRFLAWLTRLWDLVLKSERNSVGPSAQPRLEQSIVKLYQQMPRSKILYHCQGTGRLSQLA
jgi:hypothetical protein